MSKKQNPEEEQTKVTKEEMVNVMSLLKLAKFWERRSGRPPPETIRDPISYLQSLFGMNREETIAFAKRVDVSLKLSIQLGQLERKEEQHEIHLALSDLMRERLGKSKAALSLSGFLMPHEAKSIKQMYGPSGSTAAGSTAVVNQENKPWWQHMENQPRQKRDAAAVAPEGAADAGDNDLIVKMMEEHGEQQKKGGRKSRRRRRSRKKRKSRKPKKRRKRKTHRRKTRKKRTKRR